MLTTKTTEICILPILIFPIICCGVIINLIKGNHIFYPLLVNTAVSAVNEAIEISVIAHEAVEIPGIVNEAVAIETLIQLDSYRQILSEIQRVLLENPINSRDVFAEINTFMHNIANNIDYDESVNGLRELLIEFHDSRTLFNLLYTLVSRVFEELGIDLSFSDIVSDDYNSDILPEDFDSDSDYNEYLNMFYEV